MLHAESIEINWEENACK